MMSRPNSTYFKYVMDKLAEFKSHFYLYFLPEHMSILMSTGPTAIWGIYGRYDPTKTNIPPDKIGIMSTSNFGRLSVCNPNPGKPEITTIPHDFAQSLKNDARPESKSQSPNVNTNENKNSNSNVNNDSWISLADFENLDIIDLKINVNMDLINGNNGNNVKHDKTKINVNKQFQNENNDVFSDCRGQHSQSSNEYDDEYILKRAYFHHVTGNSWHTGESTFLNFFIACQIGTFLYMIGLSIWIIYNLYKLPNVHRSWRVWFTKKGLVVGGSLIVIFITLVWQDVYYYFDYLFSARPGCQR